MATSTKLKMDFAKSNGDDMSITYNYIKNNVSNANVKALMEGMITNGAIYEKVPAIIKSATIITTEETAVDLS